MGRNILEKLTKQQADIPASPASIRKMGSAPSVSGLRDGLDRLATNAVREIDPDLIDQDGLQDRLAHTAHGIAELAASIRQHGQQVPILVRPSPTPGRFRVVYGRRRLAAVRLAGGTVKAIVRTLGDKEAVLAQGQENNLRLDPSFIEKAVFVQAMRAASYPTETIMDALGVSKQSVSTYEVVMPAIPMEVVMAIGAAHSIGRRKWTELADTVRIHGVDLTGIVEEHSEALAAAPASADRFELVLAAATRQANTVAEMQHTTGFEAVHRGGQHNGTTSPRGGRKGDLAFGGHKIGHYKASAKAVSLEVSRNVAPDFGQWLEENADEAVRVLHERWQESRGKG
ncbi:plasmid partitioning protein RepB [Falsirhodobacter sp. 20TX0035]|uniref:plasmid partitioning protein RepB n=1 Tax=Falsirhodobacter sp. 20TX0035 TaxID=3022019 RepID=UPI00232B82B1|nr:plasmid partitioning protein RepB [Falsirhodobacter sp. 20TX0035]MDB6454267.1 plasmid partitioning protein RepB [Falsirhodobacter sp. 20TX0035]